METVTDFIFWAPKSLQMVTAAMKLRHLLLRKKVMINLLLSCFSRIWLCVTPQTAAQQAPHPWDSPGKNTGVGCHFLLQCMKVKSESAVAQSCLTLRDPMDCSPPGSSIHGIFQARVLEWGAIAFSDDQPRQHITKQRYYFADKGPYSQNYVFSSGHVQMWGLPW